MKVLIAPDFTFESAFGPCDVVSFTPCRPRSGRFAEDGARGLTLGMGVMDADLGLTAAGVGVSLGSGIVSSLGTRFG